MIGYYYTDNFLPAKTTFKRVSGWAAYVHLASRGVGMLIDGASLYLFLWFILALLDYLAKFFCEAIDLVPDQLMGTNVYHNVKVYEVVIVLFALMLCRNRLKVQNQNKEKIFDQLETTDSFLQVVVKSVRSQSPVKVSLKSKKVYVGLIYSEQFESADTDNIILLPYLSGYRCSDSLKVEFNSNYLDIYEKYDLLGETSDSCNFEDFMISIKSAEIESISLFSLEYYAAFQGTNSDES